MILPSDVACVTRGEVQRLIQALEVALKTPPVWEGDDTAIGQTQQSLNARQREEWQALLTGLRQADYRWRYPPWEK